MEKTTVRFEGVFCPDSSGGDTAVRFIAEDGSKQWFALSKADALDMAVTISSMYDRLSEMDGSKTPSLFGSRQEVPVHCWGIVRLLSVLMRRLVFGPVKKSCDHV